MSLIKNKIPIWFILCFAVYSGKIALSPFPSHFPKPTYDIDNNPLTKEKIELGRMLFYDPILSRDSSVSCASCHSPYNAFSHTDHALSHGIEDRIGSRNSPALFNLAWSESFMWDGAVNHLDVQPLAPISNQNEMDASISMVVAKLNRSKFYPIFFKKCFGEKTITGQMVLKSLAQFQLTLISANAKYDQVKNNLDSFTEQEEKGYKLFLTHCNSCHTEPLFTNGQFADNGLPPDPILQDSGRGKITGRIEDVRQFKIPSLRNLSYTYPYMHDGRFATISLVLRHYTEIISEKKIPGDRVKKGVSISPNEKADLIAFLLTLNDRNFIFNPEHSFPEILKFVSKSPKQ